MKWDWLNRFKKKPSFQHLEGSAKTYFESFEKRKYLPLNEETFTVLDFETTGLNPEKDRILSFAFLRINKQQIEIENRFEGYLKSKSELGSQAVNIHHVTKHEIAYGFSENEFIRHVFDFIGTSVLVGHHIAFDKACLDRISQEKFGLKLPNKTIDTALLGSRLDSPLNEAYTGKKEILGLDALCKRYDVTPEARHSAGGDTLTTAFLLLKLLKAANKRGINKL